MCLRSLPTPGTILESADLLLRGLEGLGGNGVLRGAQEVVFLTPAACLLQLTGFPIPRPPQGSWGTVQFHNLLPSPSVPGGQEKRKHSSDFLLGPGAHKLMQVLLAGEGAKPDLPPASIPRNKAKVPAAHPHGGVAAAWWGRAQAPEPEEWVPVPAILICSRLLDENSSLSFAP